MSTHRELKPLKKSFRFNDIEQVRSGVSVGVVGAIAPMFFEENRIDA